MVSTTYKRVNITLPKGTLERLDKVAGQGERSRLIEEAVREYMDKRQGLKKSLEEYYSQGNEEGVKLAEEALPLANEAWGK